MELKFGFLITNAASPHGDNFDDEQREEGNLTQSDISLQLY